MGAERKLEPWAISSPKFQELKNLTRERDALQCEKTMVMNRMHALNVSAKASTESILRAQKRIAFLKEQIKEVELEIKNSIKSAPELQKKVDTLKTIPGVGDITVATILGETNGFALFKNIRQLTSFAGLDVVLKESGKYKGKTRISKKGNSHIRKILYFPAWSAVKKENSLKQFYDRVFEKTKKAMIAGTAIQRKILILMFSIWKSECPYECSAQNFGECRA